MSQSINRLSPFCILCIHLLNEAGTTLRMGTKKAATLFTKDYGPLPKYYILLLFLECWYKISKLYAKPYRC